MQEKWEKFTLRNHLVSSMINVFNRKKTKFSLLSLQNCTSPFGQGYYYTLLHDQNSLKLSS